MTRTAFRTARLRTARRARFRAAATGAAAMVLTTGLLASCSGDDGGRRAEGTVTLDYYSLAWQKESIKANKDLVAKWNKTHPKVKVRYVQGSWDSVHDQLLTSFEGGEAPDIIHDDASDLTDFAYGGYLADLRELLPKSLLEDVPKQAWDSTTMNGGGIYGVPFAQEPRVIVANKKVLERSGVRIPTAKDPWSWKEFEKICHKLTEDRDGNGKPERYGTVWGMKEPVKQSVNLAQSAGGEVFTKKRTDDGVKNAVRFDRRDSAYSELINRQVNKDRTAPRSGLGMAGSDTLPGFFAGRYATVSLNFSFRQQVQQQAPDGFEWTVLPMPRGERPGHDVQGVVPHTLSVAEESPHKQAAADFVAYMSRPAHMADLAKGDWMLPTGRKALKDPDINKEKDGWRLGVELTRSLPPSATLGVRGYTEWSDKIAMPAFQRYYNGDIDLGTLRKSLVEDGNLILKRYQR